MIFLCISSSQTTNEIHHVIFVEEERERERQRQRQRVRKEEDQSSGGSHNVIRSLNVGFSQKLKVCPTYLNKFR